MALNIFEYYGIKEVANCYFQALEDEDNGSYKKDDIVLYLDTLKVSTIETTAETADARGGWANPKLISWDYGKEITVTLEDAVVSMEELRILLGAELKEAASTSTVTVHKNAEFIVETANTVKLSDGKTINGKNNVFASVPESGYKFINFGSASHVPGASERRGQVSSGSPSGWEVGDRVRLFWEEEYTGTNEDNAVELVISPSTFPGTFRVVGDTLIRNHNGKDQPFQFIINKAKVASEVTLTMEAEGDPSTFSMTLNVLRDDEGDMMSLVKY